MAKPVRKPPSPSDYQDPRSREYFDSDLHEQHRLVGSVTVDLASLNAGAVGSVVIPVNGALKDKGQTVEYGLPSNFDQSLIVTAAYVSDDDEVTILIRNPTGSPIDQASGLYAARVRP